MVRSLMKFEPTIEVFGGRMFMSPVLDRVDHIQIIHRTSKIMPMCVGLLFGDIEEEDIMWHLLYRDEFHSIGGNSSVGDIGSIIGVLSAAMKTGEVETATKFWSAKTKRDTPAISDMTIIVGKLQCETILLRVCSRTRRFVAVLPVAHRRLSTHRDWSV